VSVCLFVCRCVARLAERMGLASGMLGRAAGALSYRIPLSY
jgi:hypothetical protein